MRVAFRIAGARPGAVPIVAHGWLSFPAIHGGVGIAAGGEGPGRGLREPLGDDPMGPSALDMRQDVPVDKVEVCEVSSVRTKTLIRPPIERVPVAQASMSGVAAAAAVTARSGATASPRLRLPSNSPPS